MSQTAMTSLASKAAQAYIKQQTVAEPPATSDPLLSRQRACYVSIFESPGMSFRSMYGQPLPRQRTLAHEIIANTIQAIDRSPGRLRQVDLSYLRYVVAVLGPLERITSPKQLNPAVFGLYIRSDQGRTALLLPQRTGIETADDQVATALRESSINPRAEALTMYRFVVEYYE